MATIVLLCLSKQTSDRKCFEPGVSQPRLLWGLGLWLDDYFHTELLRLWELLTVVTEAGFEFSNAEHQ